MDGEFAGRAGRGLEARRRLQVLHHQDPQGREVPRRQGHDHRRRRLFDRRDLEEVRRRRGADRLRRHRRARRRHRRREVQQADAGVLLLLAALRQRELHRAQARLCRQRSRHQPGQQRADRHRPVEVQGMGARQPFRVRQERRLLAQGPALPRPADHPLRARSGRPRRRHGGGRHPYRRVQSRGAARHQAADRDRQVRRHAQGLRGSRVVDLAGMQHAQSDLRQARGAAGDVLRRRPQPDRQDRLLRLCAAGHEPDLLAQQGVLHARHLQDRLRSEEGGGAARRGGLSEEGRRQALHA